MVSEITPSNLLNAASIAKVKKTKRTERKGFGDDIEVSLHDDQQSQATQAPLGSSSIGALFNTINDQLNSDKKNIEHGHTVLDKLEQLRLSIISGQVSRSTMAELQSLLSQASASTVDPKLKEILLDIEARAAVELAKLSKA
jgi:hypothetical protein